MDSKQLREQRMRLREEQKSILSAVNEAKAWTDEQRSSYDKMDADYERLTKDIERVENFEARERELAGQQGTPVGEAAKPWYEEFRSGILRGEFRTNAQSTTDAKGGYTIPTLTQPAVDSAFKMYGEIFNARGLNILRTSNGNDLIYPTNDDTANIGYLLTEATSAETSATDTTLSYVPLNAYKYSSGLVRISRELIADSAFDFQGWLMNTVLATRLGRALALAATTGDGSSKPQGFVTGSTYGEIWDNDAALSRANILDLIHSLDPAYRMNATLMMHDSTLKAVRQVVDGNGMFIYQPSGIVGVADTIEGLPYLVNQHMAVPGTAGNKIMVVGDFSKFVVRFAGGTELRADSSRFFDTDEIGVVAIQRFDSAVLQGGAFKYMYESNT